MPTVMCVVEVMRAVLPHHLDPRLDEHGHVAERDVLRCGDDGHALADLQTDARETRANLTRDFAVRAEEDPRAAIGDASLIVIAVKPQSVAALLAQEFSYDKKWQSDQLAQFEQVASGFVVKV